MDAPTVQASFERLQRIGLSPLLTELRDVRVAARPDGQTVVFALPRPDYDFTRLVLSNPYAALVSPHADENAGGESGFIACTGPYLFVPELYQPGRALTLVRNADYRWPPHFFANRAAARIPQMHFRFEADRERQFQLLQSGSACVLSLSGEQAQQAASLPALKLYEAEGGITYLGFNFLRPRWQDVRVRQALAQAVDKDVLAAAGPFTPAYTPFSTGTIGYDERAARHSYLYEPVASQHLLTEAHFDFDQEIILLIPESNAYRTLAAIVVEQLAQIGLQQVRIRETPRTQLLSERQDFDLLLFDYAWGDYTALAIFLGAGPRNLLGYPHDDIANLVQEARVTTDPELRSGHILAAQRLVLENAVWQPLVLRQLTLAVNTECVTGERQSVTGELLFHDADTR